MEKVDRNRWNFFSVVAGFALLTLVFYILGKGRDILTPFILGVVVWYLIITLAGSFEQIKFYGRKMPHFLAFLLAFGVIVLGFWGFSAIVSQNIEDLVASVPEYQHKFQNIFVGILDRFNIPQQILDDLKASIRSINLTSFFTSFTKLVQGFFSMAGMVMVYTIFLLLEYRTFQEKIKRLWPDENKREHVIMILDRINYSTQTYIKIQTIISLCTGVLVYSILAFFGVQFAPFWGVLAFVLNFIPIFGSILATLFPTIFAIVDLGDPLMVLVVFILILSVQVTLGNIMAPRLMGKTLNLSPLVILLSLSLWGSVWGVMGAFLSIPIMVILNIVFVQFDSTRWVSVLFSETGRVRKSRRRKNKISDKKKK